MSSSRTTFANGTGRTSPRSAGARPTTSWAPATGSGSSHSPRATPASVSSRIPSTTTSSDFRPWIGSGNSSPSTSPCWPSISLSGILDFLCIRDYSHTLGRCWSTDRWGIVGEAGAFVDPLYSPGNDFIALANAFTEELIRVDLAGEDLETRTRELNIQYRVLVAGALDIFRGAAPIYGHAPAMLAKIYWDNFSYWTFLCQYYLREIYRLSGARHSEQVEAGQRIFEISNYVQSLLREWALLAPHEPEARFEDVPAFPSILVDTHVALQDEMTPDETLAYIRKRAVEAEEIAGELLVKVVSRLGEPKADELVSKLGINRWRLRICAGRIRAEKETGLARRRALSPVARDVERALGRSQAKTEEAKMFALLRPLLVEPELGSEVRARA